MCEHVRSWWGPFLPVGGWLSPRDGPRPVVRSRLAGEAPGRTLRAPAAPSGRLSRGTRAFSLVPGAKARALRSFSRSQGRRWGETLPRRLPALNTQSGRGWSSDGVGGAGRGRQLSQGSGELPGSPSPRGRPARWVALSPGGVLRAGPRGLNP